MNLTPRQTDVLVAIRNYRHIHGYAPTMQELADTLGTSKVTIFEHVGALEKKKILRRDKHKARSLEIMTDKRLPDESRATKLPLLSVALAIPEMFADTISAADSSVSEEEVLEHPVKSRVTRSSDQKTTVS